MLVKIEVISKLHCLTGAVALHVTGDTLPVTNARVCEVCRTGNRDGLLELSEFNLVRSNVTI